jgi:hypothetical protein
MLSVLSSLPRTKRTPAVRCRPRCQCGRPVSQAAEVCSVCRHGQAVFEAHKLVADVRALQQGLPPFDGLTPAERNEQLAALGLPPVTSRFPGFRTMSTDRLAEIAAGRGFAMPGEAAHAIAEATAELARRAAEPTPAERDELEERLADRDEIECVAAAM